jgi:hypothetical protein
MRTYTNGTHQQTKQKIWETDDAMHTKLNPHMEHIIDTSYHNQQQRAHEKRRGTRELNKGTLNKSNHERNTNVNIPNGIHIMVPVNVVIEHARSSSV